MGVPAGDVEKGKKVRKATFTFVQHILTCNVYRSSSLDFGIVLWSV